MPQKVLSFSVLYGVRSSDAGYKMNKAQPDVTNTAKR
eukprot:Gb_09237 [translate_table: standard]